MRPVPLSRLVAAVLLLAGPAAAQPFGPPPGYQPGPVPPSGQPSLIGTWSGQSTGPNGTIQQSDAYGPDGRFTSVARLPNGFLGRAWGTYRTTPVGPGQLRLETHFEGWLPRELCQQMAGGQPQCQPFQMPTTDTALVTFSSPNQLQAMSETAAGGILTAMRDSHPALLQAQAPERWINVVQPSFNPSQPSFSPAPAPIITPYVSPIRRGPATNIPGVGGNCDDMQQRRICAINDGHLVPSGGCLVCVK